MVSDMRASRLVSILLILQARGRATARQLADELEVSVRTIYRDAAALQAAGIPLCADAGPAGGYRLMAGFRTRLTGLTEAEARALFLTGLPGPAAELGLGAAVAAAQLKLTAALPAGLLGQALLARERFHLDAPGWYAGQDHPPHLGAVAEAVWEQRRIHVRYSRWKDPEEVERTLDPYGLVLKAGIWYLVAGSGNQARTYRVSQILDLNVLDETFARPDGFHLASYWAAYLTDFRSSLYRSRATVLLTPAGRKRAGSLLSAEVTAAIEATAAPPDRQGRIRAVVPIESLTHAESEFLRLGPDVEVIEPPELRQRLAAAGARLARLYA
jgi:predicted DNA-binding transcriptional regulator YafY